MPHVALGYVRLHLQRLGEKGATGTLRLHIAGGHCVAIFAPSLPSRPTDPDFLTTANQVLTGAQTAALAEVDAWQKAWARDNSTGNLYIALAAGVPTLPFSWEPTTPLPPRPVALARREPTPLRVLEPKRA